MKIRGKLLRFSDEKHVKSFEKEIKILHNAYTLSGKYGFLSYIFCSTKHGIYGKECFVSESTLVQLNIGM